MRVSEVMNKAVVIREDISLREAAKIMSEKGIGSLVVMRKDSIVGIITERDVLKNVNKLDKNISEIMSRDVITIEQDDRIDNAALIMAKHKIKRLPVTNKDKLVGIITATDVLANSEELNVDFFFD